MSNSQNNWRGGDDSPRAAKYRWQESNQGAVGTSLPKSRFRWRLGAFASVFLALFGWMLYIVLRTPPVTPLIVISATDYPQSMPPNAWAEEDIDALKALDRNSVEFHRIRFDRQRDDAMERLRESLAISAERPGNTVILHITMHAAVDGSGAPCMVPSDADPLNPATWIELSDVIGEANATPRLRSKMKLIIIDGVRDLASWDLGIPFNTFVERVAEQFKGHPDQHSNTAILLASGANQAAWCSPEIQGSVFGQYVRLGLAGVADELREGGNGDKRVSVTELDRFVRDRVNQWAIVNKGCRQVPLLLHSGKDFVLTSSLNLGTRRRMAAEMRAPVTESASVSPSRLEATWRMFDQLTSDGEFLRYSPREHGQLRRQLLRLEEMSVAGRGYVQSANRLLDEITIRMEGISRARTDAPNWNLSLPHRWNAFQFEPTMLPRFTLHDLPAASYLGQIGVSDAAAIQQLLSPTNGARSLATRMDLVSESSFFEILRRYQVTQRWRNNDSIQDVVDLRIRANKLATPLSPNSDSPGDERAHRRVQRFVADADIHLRSAQDFLLAGEPAGKRSVSDGVRTAHKLYDAAESHFRKFTHQYAQRDRMLADLPFVARYALDPLRVRPSNPSNFDVGTPKQTDVFGQIASISDTLKTLVANLDSANSKTSIPSMNNQWDLLLRAIDHDAKKLLQEDPSAFVARQLSSILSLPTLTGDQRSALRTRRDEVHGQLNAVFFGKGKPSLAVAPIEEKEILHDASSFAADWSGEPGNLVLSLMQVPKDDHHIEPNTDETTHMTKVEADADLLRRWLRSIHEFAVTTSDEIDQAEKRERATAAFWYRRNASDPVTVRRLRDLQRWLTWRSERSLLNFLGPVRTGDPPAFAKAATDYLAAANKLHPVKDINQRMVRVDDAANEVSKLLVIDATKHPIGDESLSVKASVEPINRIDVEDLSLSGHASLLIGIDSDAQIVNAISNDIGDSPVVAVPGMAATWNLRAPISADSLISVFRGNEFLRDLGDSVAIGQRVISEPSYDKRTTITVRKDHEQLSVLLAVDGSSSMRDSVDGKTKILNSKAAVREILAQLAEIPGVRCGVSFYGHRVGYAVDDESQKVRVHPAYAGHIPDSLTPETDVETVLPVGRFQKFDAAGVRQDLTKLTGWGQSPHYRSLLSAIDAIGSESKATQTSIILFTDGDDIAERSDGRRRLETISWYEVLNAVRASNVPIHIVSPGPSDAQDQRALQELANVSGGSLRTSDRAAALLPEILSKSKLATFAVRGQKKRFAAQLAPPQNATTKEVARIEGPSIQNRTAELIDTQTVNRPVTILNPAIYQSFLVRAGRSEQQLKISGGENIELRVQSDNDHFDVPNYRIRFSRAFPLLDGENSPLPVSAFVHRPLRSNRHASFEISLQHTEGRYVPRPNAFWIEISPIGREKYASFVFYDAAYVEDAPVPVIQCQTPDWPTSADQASVQIWCSPNSPSHAAEFLAFKDLLQKNTVPSKHKRVSFRATQPYRSSQGQLILELTEQHETDSASFKTLMVEFAGRGQPQQIEHRYDRERNVITHRFVFSEEAADSIADGKVRITPRKAIEKSSWHTGGSSQQIIDVPYSDDVITVQ